MEQVCSSDAFCNNTIGNFTCTCFKGYDGNGFVCNDIDECYLKEHNCDPNATCYNEVGYFRCVCILGFTGSGEIGDCNCDNGRVLLLNGTSPSIPQREGRVEVCFDNSYHSVCDDNWDENEANVVCRQLNISGENHFPVKRSGSRYGQGSRSFLLDNLGCTGVESTLLKCNHGPLGVSNCDHREDAGVVCGVVCSDNYVRLVNDGSINQVLIKDEVSQGRVEICVDGNFHTVCDVGWSDEDASVLCEELGFSKYGAIGLRKGLFGRDRPTIARLSNVSCNGMESSLSQCHSEKVEESSCETASAVCQSLDIESDTTCKNGAVRLMNGSNSQEGRVEICVNRVWGTICQDGFSADEANIVCAELGLINKYSVGSTEILLNAHFGSGTGPIFLSLLQCEGGEKDLLSCSSGRERGIPFCPHSRDVAVRCPDTNECKSNPCHANANCHNIIGNYLCVCKPGYNGDGFDECENIDECNDTRGGCDEICSDTEGSFVCSCYTTGFELGPDGRKCIDINECMNSTLHNCRAEAREVCVNNNGSYTCECQEGYSLMNGTCEDINECLINANACGSNTICNNTEGSYVCTCRNGYYRIHESDFNCTDINECTNGTHNCDGNATCINSIGSFTCECNSGYTGNGTIDLCFDINECTEDVPSCDTNALCTNSIGSFDCRCHPGYSGNGTTCACHEGDSRLVFSQGQNTTIYAIKSSNRSEVCHYMLNNASMEVIECRPSWPKLKGRVEVCSSKEAFGTICDNRWDSYEARIVCRQLKYLGEDWLPIRNSYEEFGLTMNVDIVLRDLNCNGQEQNLLQCSKAESRSTCSHDEDAGVKCGEMCGDYDARIIIGTEEQYYSDQDLQSMNYYIDGELAVGRFEICLKGKWSPICQDSWTERDASVACNQLGFSRAGAINGNQRFELDSEDIELIQVNFNCTGDEDSLEECFPFEIMENTECGERRSAYIVCQDSRVNSSDCEDWDIRLQNGNNVREGRVEICFNHAWGTICSDSFTQSDANVVCAELEYERTGASYMDTRDEGHFAPIFLTDLPCENEDRGIQSCFEDDAVGVGITRCDHFRDVFVQCEAYCKEEVEVSPHGNYTWPRIQSESNITAYCQFGGSEHGLPGQLARRQCDERGKWISTNFSECATYSESLLANLSRIQINQDTISNFVDGLFNAAVSADDPQDQSESNLLAIASSFELIRDNCTSKESLCSLNVTELTELTNVLESLQSWESDVRRQESAQIAAVMEGILADFTENLRIENGSSNATQIFKSKDDTITYTGFKKHLSDLKTDGVAYSAEVNSGLSSSVNNGMDINNASTLQAGGITVSLPSTVFHSNSDENGPIDIVFSAMTDSTLFPLTNKISPNHSVASSVMSMTVTNKDVNPLKENVTIVLQLHDKRYRKEICVYWDENAAGGNGDWSSNGCTVASRHDTVVICKCNHLSTFGVLSNTEPVECDFGYLPDPTATQCIAVKPDVGLTHSNNMNSVEQKNNNVFKVHIGREFEVLCFSHGEYKGNVTWSKWNNNANRYEDILEVEKGVPTNLPSEKAGQLYAYRLNESAVILGTRDNVTLGAPVGVSLQSDGHYRCLTENIGETETIFVNISVEAPEGINEIYVRFSTDLFSTIQERLNIGSDGVLLRILEWSFLQFVEDSSDHQHIAQCYDVVSRPDDVRNNRTRVACDLSNFPEKRSVWIRITEQRIMEHLPTGFGKLSEWKSNEIGYCSYEVLQSKDNRGEFKWPETDVDETEDLNCTAGPQISGNLNARATRRCLGNNDWSEYDGKQCATLDTALLRRLADQLTLSASNIVTVVKEIAEVVEDLDEDDEQSEDNLETLTNVYTRIEELVENNEINVTDDLTTSTATVLNDISSWPPEVLEQRSSSMVNSFEAVAANLVQGDDFMEFEFNRDQLTVSAKVINDSQIDQNNTYVPPFMPSGDSMISLPTSVFEMKNESVPYFLTWYNTSALLPLSPPLNDPSNASNDSFEYIVDSEVLGLSIPAIPVKNSSQPIILQFSSMRAMSGENYSDPICVAYNFEAIKLSGNKTRGNWSSEGCTFIDDIDGLITCHCTHLTNFAILVNVNPPKNPLVNKALGIISIIGSSLSMFGLLVTIFTMIFFKKLRVRDASKFHAQLCIALFFMLLTFTVGIDRTSNEIACTTSSMIILYFTLAAVFWMGAEAILMFKKLVIVFGQTTKVFITAVSLIAWAVPLLFPIIGLTTLATGKNYLITSNEDGSGNCFISDNRLRYGIFLVPLFSVLIFNVVVFILVARVLIKHSRRKANKGTDDKKNVKITNAIKTLISIVSVMLMFGLSWLFGALSIDRAAEIFQWPFVIAVTSQGFLLFVSFCVIGTDAREEWKKLLSCYRYKGVKKGAAPSSAASRNKRTATGRTGSTFVSGKNTSSATVRRNVASTYRSNVSEFTSSVAPLELAEMRLSPVNDTTAIDEDTTAFINPHADNDASQKTEEFDSQLPPHVLFRLKRSYFELVPEKSDYLEPEKCDTISTLSGDPPLHTQITELDVEDEYIEENLYFDDDFDDDDYEGYDTDFNSDLELDDYY